MLSALHGTWEKKILIQSQGNYHRDLKSRTFTQQSTLMTHPLMVHKNDAINISYIRIHDKTIQDLYKHNLWISKIPFHWNWNYCMIPNNKSDWEEWKITQTIIWLNHSRSSPTVPAHTVRQLLGIPCVAIRPRMWW